MAAAQRTAHHSNSGRQVPDGRIVPDAGVNRNTMQRALSELEHDGFVITNRTAGRTVTTDEGLVARMKEQIAMQNIEKFIREMEAIGYDADDIVKMIQERGVEKK